MMLTAPAASITTKRTAENLPAAAPAASSVTTTLEATTSADSAAANMQTNLKLNGETVPLPANGSVQKTIQNDAGNATVDVSVNATSAGSAQSHSSTNIQLNVSNESEISTDNSE